MSCARIPIAGKGFRETHGLLGKLKNFFIQLSQGGRMELPADTKKFSKKSVHPCEFPAILCPASVSGERHTVRWGAPPCELLRRSAHSAAVSSGHHRPQGPRKRPTDGHPGHLDTQFQYGPHSLPTGSESMGKGHDGTRLRYILGTYVQKLSKGPYS